MSNPRTVKTRTPAKLILGLVFLAVTLLGFIFFAVWYSIAQIQDAKMTGTIVKKEFIPAAERQITVGGRDGVKERLVDGEYIITVDVPQRDGTQKPFNVWMPDRKSYDAWQVGDRFDVGPYVVK